MRGDLMMLSALNTTTYGYVLNFFDLVADAVNLRAFSALWYWVVLALLWIGLSQFILGVPLYLLARARRGDALSRRHIQMVAQFQANEILKTNEIVRMLWIGAAAFLVSALVVLGWGYGVEVCQALLFLIVPIIGAGGLSILTARRMAKRNFETILEDLHTHRIIMNLIMVVVFAATVFWGLYANMTARVLH